MADDGWYKPSSRQIEYDWTPDLPPLIGHAFVLSGAPRVAPTRHKGHVAIRHASCDNAVPDRFLRPARSASQPQTQRPPPLAPTSRVPLQISGEHSMNESILDR